MRHFRLIFIFFVLVISLVACDKAETEPTTSLGAGQESTIASASPVPTESEHNKGDHFPANSDAISSTKKENESTSEPETLASVLQWDGISYLVTNGSTGERVSLATPSDVDKMKSLLDGISILGQDDKLTVGYLYAIRAEDADGNLSDSVCVYKGRVQIGGSVGYYVENDELLINYLETQFE